ncbi:PREDICTED: probable dolichyl pyrophosphate Glc1Man9GlcNAc2 alpha-1,3-glucosyltransferase [Acropora digitifera]|uniref:probable dolichyl pyrophosphate Glc1Man9GlcNAc2 alpha-1,3-glucosyltransferase n=1 Tax=Acropora digitifera TaxID=70779 RepID=UPI00077A8F9B|nr:PREDICTED: probable dolichyl pyrophosphate Glc1Man9GlcNAc2 alpha-1,3-glucosyltransferase [Acropora digitifera]
MAADSMRDCVEQWWLRIVLFSVILKSLLMPTYHSTDFEVHRNWLAVTHNLPLSKWYYENTSEWTLDYPPLFAWFEYLLSQVAVIIDPQMVVIQKQGYDSLSTVLFQRGSVVITDLLLAYAVKEYCRHLVTRGSVSVQSCLTLFLLIIFNFGLLIVDHIHFQYNGFLFGILLLSITKLSEVSIMNHTIKFRSCSLYTTFLLWLFVFFFFFFSTVSLKFLQGQLPQVLSRLFPFKRGLCHAYWAPNFWALYNAVDKALIVLGSKLGFTSKDIIGKQASMTGGLVGQSEHVFLPSVPPVVTIVLTLLSIMVRGLGPVSVKAVLLSFMLLALFVCRLFCFSLLAVVDRPAARVFLIISTTGHLSLFPLLFRPQVCQMFFLYFSGESSKTSSISALFTLPIVEWYEAWYLYGLVGLKFYCSAIHPLTVLSLKLPFLPLMLTSVYCAVGVVWGWILFYCQTLRGKSSVVSTFQVTGMARKTSKKNQ